MRERHTSYHATVPEPTSPVPLLLPSGSIPMKIPMRCRGSALSPYLVLVLVPDDSGSVVGLPALESQSPVYFQGSPLFGACFTRGSGSLCGSGIHLPRLSLIA